MQRRKAGLLRTLGLLVLLAGCDPFEFTTESGARWFAENKRDVLWLNRRLLARPEIAWVEASLRLQFVPKFADFTAETEAAYRKIEARAEDLEIINIAVSRERSEMDGALITIRYLLQRTGFVFSSGDMLAVEYIPNERFLETIRNRPGTQVAPLDVEDWCVIVAHFD